MNHEDMQIVNRMGTKLNIYETLALFSTENISQEISFGENGDLF